MLAAALCIALCSAQQARAELRVTDDDGREIVLARPAVRVIALYGALGEVLEALGRGGALVARTNADKATPRLAALPSIGTHMRPNIEAVLAKKPDLVLQMAGRKEASLPVDDLRRRGVNVAVFRVGSFSELFSAVRRVGVLTGAEAQAEDFVRGQQARLDALEARMAQAQSRPRVFFEVRQPNMLGAGKSGMVAEIIRRAGGENCAAERGRFARVSEEEILRLAPEAYVIQRGPMNPAPPALAARPRLRTLPAAKSGRSWFVDEEKYSRPGPQSVAAAEELARLLHPELFAGDAPASSPKAAKSKQSQKGSK